MKPPYYEEPGVSIYHGDCMEIIPALSEAGISVIIADPPYGETYLEWDQRLDRWAQAAYLAVAPAATLWCFGSFRMFYESDGFSPWQLAQDVVWEKHNGSGFATDKFLRVHEYAVQFYKGQWTSVYKKPVLDNDSSAPAKVIHRKQAPPHRGEIGTYRYEGGPRRMRSVIYARSCHRRAIHPTQKPVEIIAPLLEYSCHPETVVLDPFMGSGSTLVAYRALGIRAIGIEVNEEYCAAAVSRLAQGVLREQQVGTR